MRRRLGVVCVDEKTKMIGLIWYEPWRTLSEGSEDESLSRTKKNVILNFAIIYQ